MGLAAPITGVIAAAVPVLAAIALVGPPGSVQLGGMGLAILAVVLVSRPDEELRGRDGAGLAVIAGLGFGGFYVLVHGAGDASVFWILATARLASVVPLGIFVLARSLRAAGGRATLGFAVASGTLDMVGNAFYVVAAQTGRLDVAAVLSSLYPVTTVILARVVLGERVAHVHLLGIGVAAVAVALIAAGTVA